MNQQEISELEARTSEVEALFDDSVFLALRRVTGMSLTFDFTWGDTPEVNPESKYLAVNYDCSPAMVPGFVRCDTVEEAHRFLDLVEARAPGLPDYGKVLGAANAIVYDALANAAYTFSDEWDPESLPCEVDGAPYWLELDEEVEFVTTAGWSSLYGGLEDIPVPKEEAALLVKVVPDIGAEGEVELARVLEAHNIPEDSLEELLVLQLVCHNNTPYAYIRYDIMAGVWLLPRLDNREFLDQATESRDCKYYYHGDLGNAIARWYKAVKEYEND